MGFIGILLGVELWIYSTYTHLQPHRIHRSGIFIYIHQLHEWLYNFYGKFNVGKYTVLHSSYGNWRCFFPGFWVYWFPGRTVTPLKTNGLPLKMDGWKRCEVFVSGKCRIYCCPHRGVGSLVQKSVFSGYGKKDTSPQRWRHSFDLEHHHQSPPGWLHVSNNNKNDMTIFIWAVSHVLSHNYFSGFARNLSFSKQTRVVQAIFTRLWGNLGNQPKHCKTSGFHEGWSVSSLIKLHLAILCDHFIP